MRKAKKILALLMVLVMGIGFMLPTGALDIFVIVSSSELEEYQAAAEYLDAIDVLKGYDDGSYHLGDKVQRYQAALFFMRAITGQTDDSKWSASASMLYNDVPEYGGAVDAATAAGVVIGYGNGVFGYNDNIKYKDMLVMAIRALGYERKGMVYPVDYITLASRLKLTLTGVGIDDYLTRGQTAEIILTMLETRAAIISAAGVNDFDIPQEPQPEDMEGTLLGRIFKVSKQISFRLIATDKFSVNGELAEEGELIMRNLFDVTDLNGNVIVPAGEDWTFTAGAETVTNYTQFDLIGKIFKLVFNSTEPRPGTVANGTVEAIAAKLVRPDTYTNIGALDTVKYDEEKNVVTLGKEKIDLDDALSIMKVGTNETRAYVPCDLAEEILSRSYFKIDAYDYDDDGTYDNLFYTPYYFAKYVTRSYIDGTTSQPASFTMLGKYSEEPFYDHTKTTADKDENQTYYPEYFLATNKLIGSGSKYKPADTGISVSKSAGEYSISATTSGKAVANGDFILYSYNKFSNELVVAENFGAMQSGRLTKITTKGVVIDGSEKQFGIDGYIPDAGLYFEDADETPYNQANETARDALATVSDIEDNQTNVRYIEYLGNIVHLETCVADEEVKADYIIIDPQIAYDDYKTSDDDIDDMEIDTKNHTIVVSMLDPSTAKWSSIKVRDIDNVNFADLYRIDKSKGEHTLEKTLNAVKAKGYIFTVESMNDDGSYNLTSASGGLDIKYANTIVGTDVIKFSAAGISNKFVAVNDYEIPTGRLSTTSSTISIIIANDGVSVVKGKLDDDNADINIKASAQVLSSTSSLLVIYDRASTMDEIAGGNENSVWLTESNTSSGTAYYVLGVDGNYNGISKVTGEGANKKYFHAYTKLTNLLTNATENVVIETDSGIAPVRKTGPEVMKVSAAGKYLGESTFAEVYIGELGYHDGLLVHIANDAACIKVDANDDGTIDESDQNEYWYGQSPTGGVEGLPIQSLNYTFLDFDEGSTADPEKYNFDESYVTVVDPALELTDNEYVKLQVVVEDDPNTYYRLRNYFTTGVVYSSRSVYGKISPDLTRTQFGMFSNDAWFKLSEYATYYIPSIDDDGDTIYNNEKALNVEVQYQEFIKWDKDTGALEAVIVRIGEIK